MDLYSMIEAGGNIKVEVSAADLCQFADKLIEKAQLMKEHELMRQEQAADEEKWLSTEEACKMCGVCTTTLWAWDKAGYLRAAKVGRRKRYTLSSHPGDPIAGMLERHSRLSFALQLSYH